MNFGENVDHVDALIEAGFPLSSFDSSGDEAELPSELREARTMRMSRLSPVPGSLPASEAPTPPMTHEPVCFEFNEIDAATTRFGRRTR